MEVFLHLIMIFLFNPLSLSFIKFNSNDPPLNLSPRRSSVEKLEYYAQILKGLVALKW